LSNVVIIHVEFDLVFCGLTQFYPVRLATRNPRRSCWLGWRLG